MIHILLFSTNSLAVPLPLFTENSQLLEVIVTDLERAIETQNDEADIAISQWETRCSTFSGQLEETEQGINDNLQKKIEPMYRRLKSNTKRYNFEDDSDNDTVIYE